MHPVPRRSFLRSAGAILLAPAARRPRPDPLFRISLAQWSLHRAHRAGELSTPDFPAYALRTFGIDAVEYVNTFFKDKPDDQAFLTDLRRRCDDLGVRSLLIMCDGEGALGDPDPAARRRAVDNHLRWVHAARALGCHSIRVNAHSTGSPQDQLALVADGLHALCDRADPLGINVLVENHGGLSADANWLADLMRRVDHPRCGTLPDFGNFSLPDGSWFDRYEGVRLMMPWAKAVSAKSHDFDPDGNETHTDFRRMLRIVTDAGYRGYVGIEYEGDSLPEPEGIRATLRLLRRVRDELSPP